MPLVDRLPHAIVIRRFTETGPAVGRDPATREWADVGTAKAWVQRTGRAIEVEQEGGDGTVVATHRTFLPADTDITTADVFRQEPDDGLVHEVLDVEDVAGIDRHLEVLSRTRKAGGA